MKKILLYALVLSLFNSIHPMERQEQEPQSNEQDIQAKSKFEKLRSLLGREGFPSLLFIAGLQGIKNNQEINPLNIPPELKDFIVQLKNDLNQELIKILELPILDQNQDDVKLLIEAGANVNIQNKLGNTALIIFAGIKGNLQITNQLVDKSADVNLQNQFGNNPLILAASNGHLEIVKLLLDSNAEVDLKDNHNGTALMYATWKGHLEIVRLLIDKGADVSVQNADDETALAWAIKYGHTQIAELLKSKCEA